MIDDRTAYDVYGRIGTVLQTVLWNTRGQHEYLLVYSFELNSAFDSCQLFRRL